RRLRLPEEPRGCPANASRWATAPSPSSAPADDACASAATSRGAIDRWSPSATGPSPAALALGACAWGINGTRYGTLTTAPRMRVWARCSSSSRADGREASHHDSPDPLLPPERPAPARDLRVRGVRQGVRRPSPRVRPAPLRVLRGGRDLRAR